ncbi:hypothetical protein LZZ85_14500 [Terrimonas sp. NA20]|uniref:Uncharacterized protein n=1 Tax=Terrimonas ginsenosidimutans TaxID=2908004 RepID=A0ABS9KT46_9BACT|nr:hypothetical protein [Terrimonas ginsenosidimutans]MCG2615507.1 hypothetical protein [Terrimonas ginsenosidimutans]
MIWIKILIVLLGCSFPAVSQPGAIEPVETTGWCQVGDTKIAVKTYRYGSSGKRVIVNLHHNEITAIEAAHKVLSLSGGMLVHIENGNERLISFRQEGRLFRFDPNRIFTEAGIRKTLAKLSGRVTPAAIRSVRKFAAFMKSKLTSSASVVIAVHNNEDGDLSVDSYDKSGDLRREASQVYATSQHDADNFFLTTDASLFRKLKAAGYNVVLQHSKRATDDGSLSVYYGLKKKKYVNVEAETGQFEIQEEMIGALVEMIDGR